MHTCVFAELTKKRRLARAIKHKDAISKAVIKIENNALGTFEAKRSCSWLSEMHVYELTLMRHH